MLAPVELARDHEAGVLRIVRDSSRPPPGAAANSRVDRNDRLAKRVDLIDPPELLETLDRSLQVGPNAIGLGLRIQSEGPVNLIGILVVPLREQLVGPFPVAGLVGPAAHGDAAAKTVQPINPMTTSRKTFMAASLGVRP